MTRHQHSDQKSQSLSLAFPLGMYLISLFAIAIYLAFVTPHGTFGGEFSPGHRPQELFGNTPSAPIEAASNAKW